MKPQYLIILLLCTLFSCKTFEYEYGVPGGDVESRVLEKAGYLKRNEAFLCFTRNYDTTGVKVSQNNAVLFNDKITTFKGMARVLKIDKNLNTTIAFEGIKKVLTITPEQMSGYKSIQVYRKTNKIFIHFYDGSKRLNENNIFFDVYTIKNQNCKITNIDSTSNAYLIKFYQAGLLSRKKEGLMIIEKKDTLIRDLQKLKIGNTYKLALSDKFYNEMIEQLDRENKDSFYYDSDEELIWERKTNRKFYENEDLINLYYRE
jgi:hypothetical protein